MTPQPGATVKDGKVVLLYRSEDKSGILIGECTSGSGYVESGDGLYFTWNTTPYCIPPMTAKKNTSGPVLRRSTCSGDRELNVRSVLHAMEPQSAKAGSGHIERADLHYRKNWFAFSKRGFCTMAASTHGCPWRFLTLPILCLPIRCLKQGISGYL
jgi:hypothetical protein